LQDLKGRIVNADKSVSVPKRPRRLSRSHTFTQADEFFFLPRFEYLQLRKRLGKKKRPLDLFPATFAISWRSIRDNLRNFFLSPPAEMLSLLQQLREAV
jgi:hypothetical protein